ncbi:MAG: creatininase family protein [Pseudomonadota bacterium]
MIMEEMTSPEFAAGLQKTRTAILPLGALEEHGRHLPLMTDTLHMAALARAAAERIDVFVAPALPYGLCRGTSQHPGTVSIGFETVRLLVRDVGLGLYRQGVRRLIVASGHAGASHQAAMVEAGEDLSAACPDLVVAVLSVVELLSGRVGRLMSTPGDAHSGELETSIVMHLAPGLVKGTSPREYPSFPAPILVRNKVFFWPGGVCGDPGAASAEKGRELFSLGVQALVELIEKVNSFEEPR